MRHEQVCRPPESIDEMIGLLRIATMFPPSPGHNLLAGDGLTGLFAALNGGSQPVVNRLRPADRNKVRRAIDRASSAFVDHLDARLMFEELVGLLRLLEDLRL